MIAQVMRLQVIDVFVLVLLLLRELQPAAGTETAVQAGRRPEARKK